MLSRAKEELGRDGVTVIRSVFTQQEANIVRGAALLALTKSSPDLQYNQGGRLQTANFEGVEFPAILFWPALISAYLNKIRSDDRLVSIVSALVGPNVKQLSNQIYFRLPGDADSFSWHQDIIFRNSPDYPEIETSFVQTVIAVDPVSEENAPIRFVAGSHKLGMMDLIDEDRSNLRDFSKGNLPSSCAGLPIISPCLSAGDIMVWNLLTVHSSEQNNSANSRMTYMNGFCSEEHSRYWPQYSRNRMKIRDLDASAIPFSSLPP